MEFITGIDDFRVGMPVECFYNGKLLDDYVVIQVRAGSDSEKPSVMMMSTIVSPGNKFRFSNARLWSQCGRTDEWLHIREEPPGKEALSQSELPYKFRKH